jgi:hypothetical protein
MSRQHNTAHEIKFVREISNPATLRRYIDAAARRADWDGMDAGAIITAAQKRLAEIEKKRSAR